MPFFTCEMIKKHLFQWRIWRNNSKFTGESVSALALILFPVLQDLSEGIRQITTFFGFSLTEAQVQQIAEGSTFSAMKESSANSHGAMGNVIFRKGALCSPQCVFTESTEQLFHPSDSHSTAIDTKRSKICLQCF